MHSYFNALLYNDRLEFRRCHVQINIEVRSPIFRYFIYLNLFNGKIFNILKLFNTLQKFGKSARNLEYEQFPFV